jgi:hypothetical protein
MSYFVMIFQRNINVKLHCKPNGLNRQRIFHQIAAEFTLFSSACGIFSRIHHNMSPNNFLGCPGYILENSKHCR